ncbi:MAG: hypothetical protein AAF846_24055 [Chloroflexota bacterium]
MRDRQAALDKELYTSVNLFINNQRYMGNFELDELVETVKNKVHSVRVYEEMD